MSRASNDLSTPAGGGFLRSLAPYIVMLLFVFAGMAVASVSVSFAATWWQITAVVFAIICIASEWGNHIYRSDKLTMALKQAAHWVVIIVAMRTLFYHDILSAMTPMALGLAVLGLLAIGTLLAGIHLGSWQIGLVGVLLALAVPASFWLERISLLITAAAVVVVAIVAVWYWQKRKVGRGVGGFA